MEIDTDKDFEALIAQKNHREIIAALGKILNKLSVEQNQPDVVVDTTGIEKVLKTIKNTSVDDKLPSAIKAMGEAITKKLDNLKKPDNWTFNIQRDKSGLIKTVTATSK
jgi:hypothetical protein